MFYNTFIYPFFYDNSLVPGFAYDFVLPMKGL